MFIYCIINLTNGKRYIGQTIRSLEQRFKEHCKNTNSAIGQAIAECGADNFRIELIEKCKTIEQLNVAEQYWIEKFNCRVPKGYNVRQGGFGYIHKSKMKSESQMTIAEAFKRFRRDLKLSQRDVAQRLNISQPAYAVYESKGNSPTGATLIKMANEFNVSTDYLLGLVEDPRPWQSRPQKTEKENIELLADCQNTENLSQNEEVAALQVKVEKIESALAKQGIRI